MYIEKISFTHLSGGSQKFAVKVGAGPFKNILLAFGSEEVTHDFVNALEHCFLGHHTQSIAASEISCVDQDGDRWQLERNNRGKFRVLKGDLVITDPSVKRQALASVFDREEWHENKDAAGLIRQFTINKDGPEITVHSLSETGDVRHEIKKVAEERTKELATESAGMLSCPQLHSPKLLRKIGTRLEPLYYQVSSLVRHKRQFFSDVPDASEGDFQDRLASLETEVSILQKIDDCARPILDPKNNPKLLREKLGEVERQLSKLSETTKAKALPPEPLSIPWSKLIEVKTEMQAHKDLLGHSERLKKIGARYLDNAFEEQITSLGAISSRSQEVTRDLESCLQMMAAEAGRARDLATKASRTTIGGKLAAFLQPDTAVEAQNAETQMAAGVQQCRTKVNDALEKLGQVMALKITAEEKFAEYKIWKENNSKEISSRYSKLSQYWRASCQKYKLPEGLSLESLLKLAVIAGKLARLQEQAADLRNQANEFTKGITRLRNHLENYRTSTDSSKDAPLSTSPLVMSEAQQVLRSFAHKRTQLEDMSKRRTAFVSYTEQRDAMNARLRELQDAWAESFKVLGIEPIAVGNKNWLSVFQRIHSIRALAELTVAEERPHTMANIFAKEQPTGISVLNWDVASSEADDRQYFIEQLQHRDSDDFLLVVCQDRALAESLQRAGASIPRRDRPSVATTPMVAAPAQKAAATRSAARPNNPPPPTIKEKANRAMAIFEAAKAKNLQN